MFTSFTEHQYYIICHKVSLRLNTFSENVTFLQARGSGEFGTFADNSTHTRTAILCISKKWPFDLQQFNLHLAQMSGSISGP